jgi:hypothetical protein
MPPNRVNVWYCWMKSVQWETQPIEVWNIYPIRGVVVKITWNILSIVYPLNYGYSNCVSVTIVTDWNSAKTCLIRDGWYILSYIRQCGLWDDAVGWGTAIHAVKFAGSVPIRIFHWLKFLKPTCYVMHQQFNIQHLYVLPTLHLCVLYLSENKQRLVPLTA